MKKIIAALIGVPIAFATIGDDVMRFLARYGDDTARVVSRNADDVSGVARGLRGNADDIARVPPIAQSTNEVASVAPGVVNLNKAKGVAKQVVYQDVHNAILSGANQSSINDLMAIAREANNKQYQQTGVLLTDAALLAIVYQAGAANASPRS